MTTDWEPLLQGTGLDGWRESEGAWKPGEWSRDGTELVGHMRATRRHD